MFLRDQEHERAFFIYQRKGEIMEQQTETVMEQPTETVTEQTNQTHQPETGKSAEDRIKDMETALKKANSEAAKYRKAAEAAEAERKAKEEAELSETDKLRKKAAELEAELNRARVSMLQRDAATKHNLPPELASRLKGETLEELEADAKALAELLPKPQAPHVNPTNPGGGASGETPDQKRIRLGLR
ncbi:MAG: hypothetical protein WC069_07155 [Candidatus Shapirobacteria bacterium]